MSSCPCCSADSSCPPAEEAAPILQPRLVAAGILALASEAAHFAGLAGWAALLPALGAIALSGVGIYLEGWRSLKKLDLNMTVLMSLAVTGALLIGQWPEAAMVMVLFNLSEAIEARSLSRARAAVTGLLSLAPETATVRQAGGRWVEVPAERVAVGDRVRVRPGERVSLDGRIAAGASALNQSPITGESLPVEKTVGDQVFAGSINESGSFEFTVTALRGDSTLARVVRAVEEAQARRAPLERFVDRFARIYTPSVLGLALLTAALPPLLFGGQWFEWIYKALVLLMVACPCALVISTPVTIVSGLTAAARRGLLIKGGAFLELGRQLRWIALDKTGTLTTGRPQVAAFHPWGQAGAEQSRRLGASLAARSDHPVSKAIAEAAQKESLPLWEVENFAARPGLGISGRVEGAEVYLGNHRFLHSLGVCSADLEKTIDGYEARGHSVVGLVSGGEVRGLWAVADGLKEHSREAVAELKALGISTVMLSGDNERVAHQVAAAVGVDSFRAELLPEDKARVIGELRQQGPVGMVGDGINDAPALAAADIGFAMGAAGTDTAIETADVALMDDDLNKLPGFIRLSRRTHRLLRQNISLALGFKAAFLLLTFLGFTTMWMAVFADLGVSLMVLINGLRAANH